MIEINVTRFDQPRDALFVMVGLPDSAVKESKTRVRSALENSGYPLASGTDMAINFAPADVKKEGSSYDLPLAVGLCFRMNAFTPSTCKSSAACFSANWVERRSAPRSRRTPRGDSRSQHGLHHTLRA